MSKENTDTVRLIPPHGGILKPLLAQGNDIENIREEAKSMPAVRMSSRETSDLIMLGAGAFTPLDGFMRRNDYLNVVKDMHMRNGLLWPIPITLSLSSDEAARAEKAGRLALVDDDTGTLMGTMSVEDLYDYDKAGEARHVFGTDDPAHPGAAKLLSQKDMLAAGPVKVVSELDYPTRFGDHYARPAETRRMFARKGWKTVAAFQTRNPIHRSHEYCTKIALEICDGLFIHPLVGKLKQDDIPADVRMKCYEALLRNYYPADRVICRVYPMEMRYAGPREAVLHAIFRQNYGCTHLIVGRDHAGVGKYYGPFDAQKIFDRIGPDELAIKPLKIDWTFWCYECEGMASMKTCPHAQDKRLLISGTELRRMLAEGEMPPKEFSRPEILKILMEYYRNTQDSGPRISGKNA